MNYHLSVNKRSVMAIASICYVIQKAVETEANSEPYRHKRDKWL